MLHKVTNALRLHVESDSCSHQSRLGLIFPSPLKTHRNEESLEKLGSVWNQVLVILEDGVDGKDCIFADK